MAEISKNIIQKFYSGLREAKHKSDFDQNFLREHSLEFLSTLNTVDFTLFFSARLKDLQYSDYDWTKVGQVQNGDWYKSNQHANYHWYHLALIISELTEKHITEIIFTGVDIAEKDRSHLCNVKQFSTLIYAENGKRLVILSRMLKVAESTVSRFANYDGNGDEHPVSLYELLQIRCKLENNSLYKPIVIANWREFRGHYIAWWGTQAQPMCFEDLVYPLYGIVENYFEELLIPGSVGSIYELLQNFHNTHLKSLNSQELNFFYGQCIKNGAIREESLYMLDILLNLMDAKDDLSVALPDMVQLAVWITHQNPAMVISHPDVLQIYRSQEIGPYLTQQRLGNELVRLLRFREELYERDFLLIDTLKDQLLINDIELIDGNTKRLHEGPVPQQELFRCIREIFCLRDLHNRTEKFIDIRKIGIMTGSYQYLYHRTGVNVEYIRVAQFLQASGFLKRYGIDDYFQLLMPGLQSPVDAVTGGYLSDNPFSHYVLPENDESYLIYLGNSVESHKSNHTFYNVNIVKAVPFSPKEFECINLYAAQIFRKYPRIPKFTNYRLRASILRELVDLVNNSLNYDAIQDGDGYRLHLGFSQCWTQIPEKVIEYEIEIHSISYRIRDSWNTERIHTDNIVFKSAAEHRAFLLNSSSQRLMFILHAVTGRGHARANLSMSNYYKAYLAYNRFRQFYLEIDKAERERLDMVSMRYGLAVRTFGEVWMSGFPDCMSAASKWFSTLILDYLPGVRFRYDLEHNSKYSEYLLYARRDSQFLCNYYIENDLTDSIADLIHLLTHVSVQVASFAGLKAIVMELLGVTNTELPINHDTASLLSIVDCVISPSLSHYSFFGLGKKQDLIAANSLRTPPDSGSTDSEADSSFPTIGIFSEKGSRSHSPESPVISEHESNTEYSEYPLLLVGNS